jgi:lipopolysaccharide/colanic/teichoic acid biosynthesis glycosyltransferase
MLKRTLDLTFAAIGLSLSAPLFAVLATLIKREDGGPVFYRGVRVGRGGVPFQMFKFRTMVVNADRIGGPSTADGDPRITRIGRWLRRHKLDELPQFLNVLTGEMSFVGPRPEVPYYVSLYTPEEKIILSVRPGITDLATLWNANEGEVLATSADPEKAYMEQIRPEKIRLQLEYVHSQSVWIDLSIIWRTVAGIVVKTKPRALEALKEKPTA